MPELASVSCKLSACPVAIITKKMTTISLSSTRLSNMHAEYRLELASEATALQCSLDPVNDVEIKYELKARDEGECVDELEEELLGTFAIEPDAEPNSCRNER